MPVEFSASRFHIGTSRGLRRFRRFHGNSVRYKLCNYENTPGRMGDRLPNARRNQREVRRKPPLCSILPGCHLVCLSKMRLKSPPSLPAFGTNYLLRSCWLGPHRNCCLSRSIASESCCQQIIEPHQTTISSTHHAMSHSASWVRTNQFLCFGKSRCQTIVWTIPDTVNTRSRCIRFRIWACGRLMSRKVRTGARMGDYRIRVRHLYPERYALEPPRYPVACNGVYVEAMAAQFRPSR